jgi:hypothetical protein
VVYCMSACSEFATAFESSRSPKTLNKAGHYQAANCSHTHQFAASPCVSQPEAHHTLARRWIRNGAWVTGWVGGGQNKASVNKTSVEIMAKHAAAPQLHTAVDSCAACAALKHLSVSFQWAAADASDSDC